MKDLDWGNLSFGYMKTDYNVRCYYRDGKWGEIEVCSDEYLKMHMAATCLHYGQEAFEGLKAYRCKEAFFAGASIRPAEAWTKHTFHNRIITAPYGFDNSNML